MDARQYHTPDFADVLLDLLRDDLQIPGWDSLPSDLPASLLRIQKISGALTNAVFFVSVPEDEFEVTPTPAAGEVGPAAATTPAEEEEEDAGEPATPVLKNIASLAAELERGRTTPTPETMARKRDLTPPPSAATPSSSDTTTTTTSKKHTVRISAPTTLVRVYGPSSGSLISRKTELHVLHTLSSSYSIGPRILGTFANGRVEEYFDSRALTKEEMRAPRISRAVARRMRELHRVDLDKMVLPGGGEERPSSSSSRSRDSSSLKRPGVDPLSPSTSHKKSSHSSSHSIYSTSSSSSIFSFGTSTYSNSSAGSTSSQLTTTGTPTGSYTSGYGDFGAELTSSPLLQPHRRGSFESTAGPKRRSRSLMVNRARRTKDKLGAWENITRWTREAKLVLKELDQLVSLPGFSEFVQIPIPEPKEVGEGGGGGGGEGVVISPLAAPSLVLSLREELNLPLFEQQVKLYRNFVRAWEKNEGKSKRVFAHNDAQYGNLLLEKQGQGQEGDKGEGEGKVVIHAIDFEYSCANARGFDIANHFIEWQADYHHPTLSHSLIGHGGYPTPSERARFLRAYVGCDGGLDTASTASEPTTLAEEDPRVVRLHDEVTVWQPSSHAMWAVWGIVQAKEDLLARIKKWKKGCEKLDRAKKGGKGKKGTRGELAKAVEEIRLEEEKEEEEREKRPQLHRGKSGEAGGGSEAEVGDEGEEDEEKEEEEEEEEEEHPIVFDYLAYALGRIRLFRQELKGVGVWE